jgi:hypothetical protein
MATVYAYVAFGGTDIGFIRVGGPGLGNLLFPWARATIQEHRHRLVSLAPTWPQLKVGPLLRREPDKRLYLGLMSSRPRDVHGLRRAWVLARVPRVPESELAAALESGGDRVVVFAGMTGLFSPLRGHAALVREALAKITLPAHQCLDEDPFIGVHVRLGDFQRPAGRADPGQWNLRTPIAWYCHTVEELRRSLTGATIRVFSDGTSCELAPLLSMPGVTRAREHSALASIWSLSRATAIVGSGSTFSMWAAFLGGTPVVWPLGQMRDGVHEEQGWECERGDAGGLSHAFISACQRHAVAAAGAKL